MALKTKKSENQSTIPVEAVEIVTDNEIKKEVNQNPGELQVVNDNQNLPDYAILNPEVPMSAKVEVATNIANTLSTVIESQGLVKYGLNKKDPEKGYVLVEGWEVLGTFLGIVPITKIVDDIKNPKGRIVGYKARATLLQNPVYENGEVVGGTVLSSAEASATIEGFQKETFSMMSMAQTRALGKCYRATLGWIMKMAGYEGAFAEDMPKFREE